MVPWQSSGRTRVVYRHNRWIECVSVVIAGALLLLAPGCALTGSVVSQGNFETPLSSITLAGGDALRVYYGGGCRHIPLKEVHTLIINPSISATVNDELCFSAEITLKDGTLIQSIEKNQTVKTEVFVSTQHELVGRYNGAKFTTGFENIVRLVIN